MRGDKEEAAAAEFSLERRENKSQIKKTRQPLVQLLLKNAVDLFTIIQIFSRPNDFILFKMGVKSVNFIKSRVFIDTLYRPLIAALERSDLFALHQTFKPI